MKKRFYGIILICALLTASLTGGVRPAAAAAYLPETVRVGLEGKFSNKASISVSNNSVTIGYETGGSFMPMATLAARSGYSVEVPRGTYVSLHNKTYPDYAAVKQACADMGAEAVPHAASNGGWHICAGPFATNEAAELYAVGAGAVIHPSEQSDLMLNIDGKQAIMFDSWFQLSDGSGGLINMGGSRYRGRIEFIARGTNVSAVNIVPLELYLYGVVPMEMPSSFMAEALKAQAVAARTYAASRLSPHASGAYELCDTNHCQVYGGADKEAGATTSAVDATRGVMAFYNGTPIDAVYFSSSGGQTESSENVWGAGIPYLRGVKELNEPPTAWSRTYTFEQIDALLTGVGPAREIRITAASEAGRVQELTIVGTFGVTVLRKDEIRTFFSRADNTLPSRLFTLVHGAQAPSQQLAAYAVSASGAAVPIVIQDSFAITSDGALFQAVSGAIIGAGGATGGTALPPGSSIVLRDAGSVTFSGSGNGHGVGMSQHGANGMAQLGYDYKNILKHYYTGIDVK